NASPGHLEDLCDLLISEVKKITITTSVMVWDRMTPELYAKMFKAGFRTLMWGIESGSDTVLEAMGKRGNAAEAGRNLRLAREAGLTNLIFIILGHPAENQAEFEETLDFLRRNRDFIDRIEMIQPCYIQQGTRLAENMNRKGVVVPGDLYEFGSWILGGNNLFERQRRVHEARDEAVRLGIPVN
ncbi:MAG TPA: radical SAM protein, partial [Candidatus Sumerlaeota bacterium]|nr:radical SAM protein [Candidatus Sumerlaeota bacterium]